MSKFQFAVENRKLLNSDFQKWSNKFSKCGLGKKRGRFWKRNKLRITEVQFRKGNKFWIVKVKFQISKKSERKNFEMRFPKEKMKTAYKFMVNLMIVEPESKGKSSMNCEGEKKFFKSNKFWIASGTMSHFQGEISNFRAKKEKFWYSKRKKIFEPRFAEKGRSLFSNCEYKGRIFEERK